MTKENNHGPYEFLGNMVVSLMNVDPSICARDELYHG